MATGLARLTVVLLALLLVACPDGDSESRQTSALIGNVVDVLNQQATLDGRRTAGGEEIRSGAVLATDNTGAARFKLRNDPADCELRPSSTIEVLATEDLLFRVTNGTAVCDRPGARSPRSIATPSSRIEVGDSTFSVETRSGTATHRIYRGSCGRVMSPSGKAQGLCPQQQTVVAGDDTPQPPMPFDLDKADTAVQQAVRRIRPDFVTSTTTTSRRGASTTTSRRGDSTTTTTSVSVPTTRRGDTSP